MGAELAQLPLGVAMSVGFRLDLCAHPERIPARVGPWELKAELELEGRCRRPKLGLQPACPGPAFNWPDGKEVRHFETARMAY
jgi:hypothetical protein